MIFVYMFRAAFESVSKKSKVGVAGIAGTTGTAEENNISRHKLMKRFHNTFTEIHCPLQWHYIVYQESGSQFKSTSKNMPRTEGYFQCVHKSSRLT